MKLEVNMLVGPEAKQFLVGLTKQLDRMEKLSGGRPGEEKEEEEELEMTDTASDDSPEDAEEESFEAAPKRGRGRPKKEAANFDDGDESEKEEIETEEEEEPAPRAARGKKGPTLDDVNDACKALAARTNRAHVLSILKTKFKVKSVSELDAEDYAAVIKALK